MRAQRAFWSVVLLALPVTWLPVASQGAGTVLLSVDKQQAHVPTAELIAEMQVVQELDRAWLVRVPPGVVPRLSAAAISHRAFDPIAPGAALFLVTRGTADDATALSGIGTVWPLDAYNWLLAASTDDIRELLPARLHLNRLPERLDATPTFERAGVALAAGRPRAAASLRYAPAIPKMVNDVSASNVVSTIEELGNFQTRYASTSNLELAGDYVYNTFAAMGLSVERDPFTFSTGYATNNIVATLPGKTDPSTVVIVGAHYDSTSNNRLVLAPGADDNASGTAVVLELARVLRNYQFDFTIKFIAFSAEEWGLYGSTHYAQSARYSTREKILGMVNLDMVGYVDREPEDLDLIVNATSEWLANAFADAAAQYAPLPTLKNVNSSLRSSDHAPFWSYGFSALEAIEDYPLLNPNYHKTYDTSSTLNPGFLGNVARTSAATIASIAQPISNPAPPTNVGVYPRVLRSLFLRTKMGSLTWNASSGGAAGYNVYRSTQQHGAYQKINSSPVVTTWFVDRTITAIGTYYYVVTAVDGSGMEGNSSAPVVMTMNFT